MGYESWDLKAGGYSDKEAIKKSNGMFLKDMKHKKITSTFFYYIFIL